MARRIRPSRPAELPSPPDIHRRSNAVFKITNSNKGTAADRDKCDTLWASGNAQTHTLAPAELRQSAHSPQSGAYSRGSYRFLRWRRLIYTTTHHRVSTEFLTSRSCVPMAFTVKRVCLHMVKSPQGSSSHGCCLTVLPPYGSTDMHLSLPKPTIGIKLGCCKYQRQNKI